MICISEHEFRALTLHRSGLTLVSLQPSVKLSLYIIHREEGIEMSGRDTREVAVVTEAPVVTETENVMRRGAAGKRRRGRRS